MLQHDLITSPLLLNETVSTLQNVILKFFAKCFFPKQWLWWLCCQSVNRVPQVVKQSRRLVTQSGKPDDDEQLQRP